MNENISQMLSMLSTSTERIRLDILIIQADLWMKEGNTSGALFNYVIVLEQYPKGNPYDWVVALIVTKLQTALASLGPGRMLDADLRQRIETMIRDLPSLYGEHTEAIRRLLDQAPVRAT